MINKILIIIVVIFTFYLCVSFWHACSYAAVVTNPKLIDPIGEQNSVIQAQLKILCEEQSDFCGVEIAYKSIITPWYARLWYNIFSIICSYDN